MPREVNPDALYHFLLNNWPGWANAVCPEALPTRARPDGPTPADLEAMEAGFPPPATVCPSVAEPEQPTPDRVVDEYLRTAPSFAGLDATPSEPVIDEAVKPAPVADPRLTDMPPLPFTPKELNAVWCNTEINYAERQSALARFVWEAAWQAVADAQLAKADRVRGKVTISEAEVTRFATAGGQHVLTLIVWLKAHGVEVVP